MCKENKLASPLKTPVIGILQRNLYIFMKDKKIITDILKEKQERGRNIPAGKICATDSQTAQNVVT